jgi:hypothetical protein
MHKLTPQDHIDSESIINETEKMCFLMSRFYNIPLEKIKNIDMNEFSILNESFNKYCTKWEQELKKIKERTVEESFLSAEKIIQTHKLNKIENKLPEINKEVLSINKHLTKNIIYCKLSVYDPNTSDLVDPDKKIKKGDIYWRRSNVIDEDIFWETVKDFPYWIYIDVVKDILISNFEFKKETKNQFELLDL